MAPRPVIVLALAMAAGVLAIGTAMPAQASAYRYWTYWQADDDSWTFATQGPATSVPVDGAVEGWRFAVTTQSGAATDAPRTPPAFDEICGSAPAEAGNKRIALVIDYGPAAIAPEGQAPPATMLSCVEAAEDASSFDVLQSVVAVQTDGGLICALDAYPQGECAPVLGDEDVAALTAAASTAAGGERRHRRRHRCGRPGTARHRLPARHDRGRGAAHRGGGHRGGGRAPKGARPWVTPAGCIQVPGGCGR